MVADFWGDDITEADVELQGDLGFSQFACDEHADAAVAIFIANGRGPDVFPDQSIFVWWGDLADVCEDLFQSGRVMFSVTEKVGIFSGAVPVDADEAKELCSFEDEAVRIIAFLKSGQKAAQCELL